MLFLMVVSECRQPHDLVLNDLIDENFLEDYLKLNNYNKVIVNSITKELVKLQKENFEINKQYKKA